MGSRLSDIPRKEKIAYRVAVNVQLLSAIVSIILLVIGVQIDYLLFLLLLQVFIIPYIIYNDRYLKKRKELKENVQRHGVDGIGRIVSAASSGHSDYLDEYYDFEVIPQTEGQRTQEQVRVRVRMSEADFEKFRKAGQLPIRYIPGSTEGIFRPPESD